MKGKVVVITGANAGIGKETAVGLASMGVTTVLACRDQKRAASAVAEVQTRSHNDDVHAVALDLADLASVRACATAIEDSWGRLDVLVNNAGGMWSERHATVQGFEWTFGVNYLGPFYLTNLLLPLLQASAPARVINLTSFGHHGAVFGMRWHDLQFQRHYSAMPAYAQSKLANILFTRALARRLDPAQVTVNAAHPGPVRSHFGMDGDLTGVMGLGNRLIRPFEISATAGATTSIFLATDPSLEGKTGAYWVRRRAGFMSLAARHDAAVERLWNESQRLLASVGFAANGAGDQAGSSTSRQRRPRRAAIASR
jgi:NAD(P)-dependent dehydrogenase (short-subunit alcohol dehydrogenase family)